MIDEKIKNKLVKEFEKTGSIFVSCMRAGIARSTYYRWKKDDKHFARRARRALLRGRENNCDIAEHSLMLQIKEKNLMATKYFLEHNSPRYKKKHTSTVFIEHSSRRSSLPLPPGKTLEDLIRDSGQRLNEPIEIRIMQTREDLNKRNDDTAWEPVPENPEDTH